MKVLIIEDEHKIASSIKKGLEQEHYAVDLAFDGETGFDLASSEEYDAILLDIMLPNKDGLTVCKDLRNQGIHTPIIMLTAKGQIADKIAGLDSGADDYLPKPFSFEELLARLRALVRRPKRSISNNLKIGDLELNTITFSVTRGEKKVVLSNKEFTLLEFLLRHANRIVSKAQIISQVWDYDADILPNTIEVYIRNLRKKIDFPFPKNKQLIHTVRGFGYKISESE